MNNAVYTLRDREKFEQELAEVNVELTVTAEEIKIARGFGDLSENAEYTSAKDKEAKLQSRRMELEYLLATSEFIDDTNVNTDVVALGNVVRAKDLEFGDVDEYTIVGFSEVDPARLFVSNESPIGKALIGARVGDIVTAQTPGGKLQLEVLEIRLRDQEA